MKNILLITVSLLGISVSSGSFANTNQTAPKERDWAFNGVLGHVDKRAAQRGFQVYKEVCSACHSLDRVAFRNLAEIGFSEGEIKALAASYQVKDENDAGEAITRAGLPSDYFVPPFPNEKAAGVNFNGKAPPDLSLIVKARHDGGNYIYSLLTGYGQTLTEHLVVSEGQHYNPYFAGGNILMPQPFSDGQVTYSDGTKASMDQMAQDVVTFLQWTAEPEMETRKQMGIKVLVFLAVFTGFMYVAKRNLWKKLH
jgi:ubiquinol-cytochrome c reductase cytochrome c1 subunit